LPFAVPPEDILMALTQSGMLCTVQELVSRFRGFVDQQIEGKDSKSADCGRVVK